MESNALAPRTISIKEAAARLGICRHTVRNWVDGGILDGYLSPTRRRMVLRDSVERRAREMFGEAANEVEPRKPPSPSEQLDTPLRGQGSASLS
jgi:excisionase family DNA binding protein